MPHVAKRTSIGFEPIFNKVLGTVPNPVEYELTPNTAFAQGDMVALVGGKIALATATSVTNIVGVMAESVAQADNPTAGLTYGKVYDHPDNVYRVTFVDHKDGTATGGSTTTLADSGITTTDDFFNGTLLYVYAGTNAGCVRTVSDTTALGGVLTFTNPMPAACDTTSKYILLGAGTEDGDYINVGAGGIVLKDKDSIDANADRYTAATGKVGPIVCVGASNVADLMLDVMIRRSCHIFG